MNRKQILRGGAPYQGAGQRPPRPAMPATGGMATNEDRANYQRVVAQLIRKGLKPGALTIYTTDLQFEIPLSPTNTTYEIPLKQIASHPGVAALDDNDVLFANSMRIGIHRQTYVAASNQYTPGNQFKTYHVDPGVYPTTTERAALETVYNGSVEIKTATTVRFRQLTDEFRFVPQVQTSTITNGNTQPEYGGGDQKKRGFYNVEPNIVLSGGETNTVTILLGKGAITNIDGALNSSSAESGFRNVLVVTLRGVIVKSVNRPHSFWNN